MALCPYSFASSNGSSLSMVRWNPLPGARTCSFGSAVAVTFGAELSGDALQRLQATRQVIALIAHGEQGLMVGDRRLRIESGPPLRAQQRQSDRRVQAQRYPQVAACASHHHGGYRVRTAICVSPSN